jgi:hypothetical protein
LTLPSLLLQLVLQLLALLLPAADKASSSAVLFFMDCSFCRDRSKPCGAAACTARKLAVLLLPLLLLPSLLLSGPCCTEPVALLVRLLLLLLPVPLERWLVWWWPAHKRVTGPGERVNPTMNAAVIQPTWSTLHVCHVLLCLPGTLIVTTHTH